MRTWYYCLLFLIGIGVTVADWKSKQSYDRATELLILRKGGITQRTKRLNGPNIIDLVYIAPQMRSTIKLNKVTDLLSYTICDKVSIDSFYNRTSATYLYTLCPDEYPVFQRPEYVKEYCCADISFYCCNSSEFINMIATRPGVVFNFKPIVSVCVTFMLIAVVIVIIVKCICGTRIRSRWTTFTVFERPPQMTSNYQQATPLIYPPNIQSPPGQYPYGQPPPPGQYPYGQPPPPGQYPYGQPPLPGQYPYGQPPPSGQYPYGPPPPAGQYPYGQPPPEGQNQPVLPGQNPSGQPPGAPPCYNNAIQQ